MPAYLAPLAKPCLKLLIFFLCFQSLSLIAQVDTLKEKLTFDFGLTRSRNINLWPVFKRVNTEKVKELDVLFPLFVSKKDEEKLRSYSHFVPFYFKNSTPAFTDFRLFSLYYPSVFHYSSDSNAVKSFRFFEILPRFSLMDVRKSPRGLYLDQNFLFFIWFKNDLQLQRGHFVAFPFYWYYKNGPDRSYTLFPLFSKGSKQDNKHLAITPFFWHIRNKRATSNTLFPIWFNRKSGENEIEKSSNVVFPLWWSFKSQLSTKRVLFPVFWDFNVYNYRYTTLFPLFSAGQSKDNKQIHRVITPFYWQYKTERENNRVLFPVWWRNINYATRDTATSNIIFPVSWYFKSKYQHSYTLFPLFSYGKYPAYSYFAATPFYWHTENAKRSGNTVFPLIWSRQSKNPDIAGSTTLVFPFWLSHTFQANRQKIFLPLYWDFKTANYHNITAFPFFSAGWSANGLKKYFAITPFYWNRIHPGGHSRTLFPVLWNNTRYQRGDTLKTNVLFPVWWDFSSSQYHHSLLFPVYGRFRGPGYQSSTLMPFYSSGSSTDRSRRHLAISPLYWRFITANSNTSFCLPVFYHRKAFRDPDTIRTTMLGMLWWSVHVKKNDYLRILLPVFWNIKKPQETWITFIPLFHFARNSITNSKVLRITPFYHYSVRNNFKSLVLFPVFWHKKSLDPEFPFKKTVLFPVYWSRVDGDSKSRTLFPFIWYNRNEQSRSFTLFPFLSSGRSAHGAKRHLVVTPFFWYNQKEQSASSVLFPIWWHKKSRIDGIDSRTSFLFPLWYSSKYGEDRSKVLFPLVWYFKESGYRTFTLFPLVVSGRSADGKAANLMLTPLIWYKRDTTKARFTFFPLFWYKKSEQLKYHSFLPFYFYSSSAKTRNFQLLLLLYNYRRQADQSVYNGILWKTAYWNKYADGGREFRFLYLLFANVNKKDLVEKSYFPFYYYSRVRNTDVSRAWCFYFYSRSTHFIPEIKDYYIEERIFWFLRLRSNYKQLEKEGKATYLKSRRRSGIF